MWGVDRMREFIDETTEKEGTPINRSNLMAIQGYQGETVIFGENSIVKTNSNGEVETILFQENQIVKTFSGEKTITLKTTFNDTGYITEELE